MWWLLILFAAPLLSHPGIGIVRDSRGNVFYTDLEHVWRISADGTKSIAVRSVHTHELSIDAQDNLYGEHLWYEGEATDRWGHYLWRLDRNGQLRRLTPPREGFRSDYSFVRDAAGTMYDIERNTVLWRRSLDGTVKHVPLTARLQDPRWMTVTPDGTVYVIDARDVKKIEPNGRVVTVARNLAGRRMTQFFVGHGHLLMGLWTDAAGRLYIASYGTGEIKRIDPNGSMRLVARTGPPWSPTGGFVAPDGSLWLLEYSITNAARVRKISPGGRSRVY